MKSIKAGYHYQRSLLGLFALLLWSTSAAVTRTLSEQIGTFTSASYSYLIGGILGLAYIAFRRDRIKKLIALPRGYVLSCGGTFVFYNIAMYLAVGLSKNRLQVLGVSLVNYLWPSLILVFTVVLLKRKARPFALCAGIAVSISGAYLAIMHRSESPGVAIPAEWLSDPVPLMLALGAAISWGLYSVLNKYWRERADLTEGHLMVPPVFFLTGIILLAARPLFNETAIWSARAWIELLYLALFPWLIAYAAWAYATQRGKIVLLGVFSMFLPLLTTGASCLYLQVVPGSLLWLSCVLIIIGATLCMKSIQDELTETRFK